jgi:hypothetical protein
MHTSYLFIGHLTNFDTINSICTKKGNQIISKGFIILKHPLISIFIFFSYTIFGLYTYPFPFFLFLSLATGTGKGDTPKRILPREGTRLRASLLIRGSKAGPSEGFNSRLRARGLHTHYWSEVRRPAPQKGSTAASGYSGSAPTTDQGFEGWPPKGSQPPQT